MLQKANAKRKIKVKEHGNPPVLLFHPTHTGVFMR